MVNHDTRPQPPTTLRLVRFRRDLVHEPRREIHLVPVSADAGQMRPDQPAQQLVALCGQPLRPDDVEHLDTLTGMPYVPCQLSSPGDGDRQALEQVLYPPRMSMTNSGA